MGCGGGRLMKWIIGGTCAALIGFPALIASLAAGVLVGSSGAANSSPSSLALQMIPPDMLRLYQAAGAKYGLEWEYLAAIGQVETHHGTLQGKCATSSAGARGPMQFMPDTWKGYGNGGNICDPRDAVFAAARKLKADGAPKNWRRALYAYNPAWWYVARVQNWAARYRGPLAGGLTAGAAGVGGGHTQTLTGRERSWLAPVPGSRAVCDRRIVADVAWLLRRYRMTPDDCYSPGHRPGGQHPRGVAVDLRPGPGGSWALVERAARDFGWRPSCANPSGCEGVVSAPFRVILWNGYPGHGDPSHVRNYPHLHLSWRHSPSPPGVRARTVQTLLRP